MYASDDLVGLMSDSILVVGSLRRCDVSALGAIDELS